MVNFTLIFGKEEDLVVKFSREVGDVVCVSLDDSLLMMRRLISLVPLSSSSSVVFNGRAGPSNFRIAMKKKVVGDMIPLEHVIDNCGLRAFDWTQLMCDRCNRPLDCLMVLCQLCGPGRP